MNNSQEFFDLTEEGYDRFNEISQIGYLTREFEWGGHKFLIKTLRLDEELVVGKLVKEYKDSISEEKAVMVASAAASLVSINSREFMQAIDVSPEGIERNIRERFLYIKSHWYAPVVAIINDNYLSLLGELYDLLGEMLNLSEMDRTNSKSSSDLLTEQDSYVEDKML